jgi:peptide-methionine (S)-S-oxide reductase
VNKDLEVATFGAGCFWSVEEAFRRLEGVENTAVGFMGGTVPYPNYERVCQGDTGHTEAVQIEFNPLNISYQKLLEKFWETHDPTQYNRQGPDSGVQYRSVIFYRTEEQKILAEKSKTELDKSGKYSKPIVTEIVSAGPFYRAEDYHQQYLEKRGLSTCAG